MGYARHQLLYGAGIFAAQKCIADFSLGLVPQMVWATGQSSPLFARPLAELNLSRRTDAFSTFWEAVNLGLGL